MVRVIACMWRTTYGHAFAKAHSNYANGRLGHLAGYLATGFWMVARLSYAGDIYAIGINSNGYRAITGSVGNCVKNASLGNIIHTAKARRYNRFDGA